MKFSLRNRHATMLFKNSDFVVTSHADTYSAFATSLHRIADEICKTQVGLVQ